MDAICGVSSLLVTYNVNALDPQYAQNGTFHDHCIYPINYANQKFSDCRSGLWR